MKTPSARYILIAGLLLTMTACAASRAHEATGEYVDDAAITAKVKTMLVANPITEAHQIEVETFRGVVQLSGFVESEHERDVAEQVALGVGGVRSVHDNLALRAAHRSAGEVLDDGVITTRVKTALIENPVTKAHEINVVTSQGTVQLSGFVDSANEMSEATAVARAVPGVRGVQNALEMKPAP